MIHSPTTEFIYILVYLYFFVGGDFMKEGVNLSAEKVKILQNFHCLGLNSAQKDEKRFPPVYQGPPSEL